ncbi:flagellar filament capping protein FliD [Sporomusa aerivorans]|uniref:flagellar filament capping protein FliD n=1 Tax=Sporomusa aerivorans TaxID=204936 RepID=UPI00352BA24F
MATSSSGGVGPTTVNGITRFSGLSSGIDVDSLVKKLMVAESGKLNRLKQAQQMDTWRRDQYRTITSDLQALTDKYLNVASPDSMLNEGTFQQFTVSSDSGAVSATAGGKAVKGTHKVKVNQLAKAAIQTSAKGVSKDVAGSAKPDYAALKGKSFLIQVDGTTRAVTFDSDYNPANQTGVEYVQAAINKAIGTTTDSKGNAINKVTVSEDGNGYLKIVPTEGGGAGSIAVGDVDGKGAFAALGFKAGSILSNRLNTAASLSAIGQELKTPFIFDAAGEISFMINGKEFTFDKDDTLDDMMNTINKDKDANVTMKYDENTDQFIITAKNTGAGKTLDIVDTAGNFASKVLTDKTEGQDAIVEIDGQRLTRSSNSIVQDGITYNLKEKTTTDATIGVSQNSDGIYAKIDNFIKDYNALIKKLNDKIGENYDRNYPPLTDEQTGSMLENDIKNWNQKAQVGLLQNDSVVKNLLYNMRSALMSSVQGQMSNLAQIGITTGAYSEKGQLHIDPDKVDKLKNAIASDPQSVMDLFTKKSESYPGTLTVRSLDNKQRSIRTQEEGLAFRLYDIIQDNLGIVRDSNGRKGFLLEKAGSPGDASDTSSFLAKDMETLASRIKAEQKRLDTLRNRYYMQFSNMETALEKLASQASFLSSFASS